MSEVFGDLTVNEDGSRSNAEGVVVNRPWMDQNSDDLKVHEGLAKYSTIGEASKALVEADGKLKTVSETTIPKLGDNPSTEQLSAYNEAIGVPKAADGYEIKMPDLPEGYKYDEGFEQHFRKVMLDSGMPESAAEKAYAGIMSYGVEVFNKQQAQTKQEAEDATAELDKEWGTKKAENIEKRNRAIKRFAGDMTEDLQKDADAIPAISKVFLRVFEAMGEDFFVKGELPQQKSNRTVGYDGKMILDFPSMKKEAAGAT